MRTHHCANPILLVDEVEKAGGSARDGALRSTLLALLEPGTAKCWFDECLLGNCDLSAVNWLFTANTLDSLESPFLSRVGIVRVERPAVDMFDALLAGLLRDIATVLGVTPADLPALDAAVIKALRHDFAKAGDLRRIRRAVESALGVAARHGPARPPH